jgi:hypothetical protein
MSNDDAVSRELADLSGAHLIAVEHAELVVALSAAMTALDEHGLYHAASAARAVLHCVHARAVH